MKDIKPILEGIYNNLELRQSIVPLFIGNPGISKSVQIREFAKEKGVKLVPFITSQRNPFEVSGLAMPNRDTNRMEYWDFDTLLDMKDGDILFFDELLNGNPTVLNACLTILEEREMISGQKLPNIMIVAAANPQGMVPITPQIKERFVWYEFDFPKESWQDFMLNKYKMPKEVSVKLCKLISDEEFKKQSNYFSARSIDKAVGMIINDVETPYKSHLEIHLNTLIENKLKERVQLNDDTSLEPGEKIGWLDMIRINNNAVIPKVEVVVENNNNDISNEILMYNDKDEIIGEIKDIETLKSMYYFRDEDIEDIEAGIKTPADPPPHQPRFFLFFKKNLIK